VKAIAVNAEGLWVTAGYSTPWEILNGFLIFAAAGGC
jgi:hypothetical protein